MNTIEKSEFMWRRLSKPLVEFSDWTVLAPVGLALVVMLLIVAFRREQRLKTLGWSALFVGILCVAYIALAVTLKSMFTWWVILVPCVAVALFYVGMMYFKDTQTIHPAWATFLGVLRCTVYAVLALVFLLPAWQTYEARFTGSKTILLLDVSDSMTKGVDDFPDEEQDPKTLPSRQDKIIAWLTTPAGDKGTVIERMLNKSPLSIYRFGGTLDDHYALHIKDLDDWRKKAWTKEDWTRFLKPVPPAVPEILKRDDKDLNEDEKKKRDEAQKRYQADVGLMEDLRQGTNIGRALQQVAELEGGNFIQAIMLVSDGQSNLGTEDDLRIFQNKLQKAKTTVHLFTVGVGTYLPPISLRVDDLQGPKVARPDDKFPVRIPVIGTGLADRSFKVFLDMERLGKGQKLVFGPFERKFKPGGDAQEDTTEHEIDLKELFKDELDKAKADLRLKHDDWPRDKIEQEALNVLEGKYEFTARVPRVKGESFQDAEHKSKPFVVQVQRAKPRILLFAGGPSREYQFLRTLLFREVTADRMELSVFLQTVQEGTDQDVKAENLLTKFPDTLEKSVKGDSLANYDLIIAIDPDWSALSFDQLKLMQTWVDAHAGGIIFIAGPVHSYHLARPGGLDITPLLTVYPVTVKDSRLHGLGIDHNPKRPYVLQFSPAAKQQDFLNLEESAVEPLSGWYKFFWPEGVPGDKDAEPVRGMFNFYPVDKLKADSTVLASFMGNEKSRINDGRDPQPYIVTMRYGQGKTMYIGSPETWRLRSYKEALYERFWIKLSRFMAASTAMKTNYGYISLSNEYTTGAIPFEAQLKGENGLPLPRESNVVVKVTLPEDFDPRIDIITKPQFTLQPKPGQGEWKGWFTGLFKVRTPGKYGFTIQIPGGPPSASVSHEIIVRQPNLEMDNLRTDFPALYRLATSARPISKRISSRDFDKIVQTPPEGVDPRDAPKEGRLFLRLKHADYLPEGLIQEEPHKVGEKGNTEDIWDKPLWKTGLQLSLFEILVWIFDVVGFLVIAILLITRRMWWSVLVVVVGWGIAHALLGTGIYLAGQSEPSEGLINTLRIAAIIVGAMAFVSLIVMLTVAREWVTFGNVIGFAVVVGALFLVNHLANPWRPLFAGSDMSDWKVMPKGLKGVWTVEGGTLRGSGTEGQLVSDRGDFKNFHLRAEVKTNNPDAVVLSVRTPKVGPGVPVKLSAAPDDTWCTYEVIASGERVTVKVDGKEVDEFTDKKPALGSLALQVTQPKTTVQFKSIEVREPIMLPVDISWVLLGVVGLLSVEWLTRKLLKLA